VSSKSGNIGKENANSNLQLRVEVEEK
jgi:hypothetical protein